ncbi:MAG: Ppx/GppA family phosphatase [Pseudomonadota bacterium]
METGTGDRTLDKISPRALTAGLGQGEFFGDAPPSFAPVAPGVRRIGIVDVGSNSVRLVVFEGHCRAPAVVFNEKVMCGLGARLQDTGALDPEGKARALAALRRFSALTAGLNVGALAGVGTAALRDAVDGPAFRNEIEAETGIRLEIASGADEARLAAQGVLFGNPGAEGVVIDLGGASLEFGRIEGGAVTEGLTTPLGPLRLAAGGRTTSEIDREITRFLDTLRETYGLDGGTLYLVGGSWRALARIEMLRRQHPVEVIHEFTLDRAEAEGLCAWTAAASREDLEALGGLSSNRIPHLPLAARLLGHILRLLDPGRIVASGFGLREGLCLENLPPQIQAEDPLISACLEQEKRRARSPGFGAELAEWVETVLEPLSPREARLFCAAAHLADVNWRTHPDFRADGCWETVTRTSLTDIGHDGRVFLGAALVMRYKSRSRKRLEGKPEMALLTEAEFDRAEQLGQVLRLGGTIAGHAPGILPYCRAQLSDTHLTLDFAKPVRGFTGEEVEKRLALAARALGRDWAIRLG